MAIRNEDYKALHVNDRETDFQRKRGGGFNDWLKLHTMATSTSDSFARLMFKVIGNAGPFTKFPPTNWLIKKIVKLGDTYNTKGYSVPLHADTETVSKSIRVNKPIEHRLVSPPVELIKDAINDSTYRAIMNQCLCRSIGECKDYPVDLGCMWLGPAAKVCVENGIAHEATKEECIAHVDRATACGLAAFAEFVEVEQYAWGFKDKDMPDYLAFCFCCPCCCTLIKYEKKAGGELKYLLNQSIGWHAEIDRDKCTSCGTCSTACTRDYIKMINGKPVISTHCAGCGHCVLKCPEKAIKVVQYKETKPKLADYFDKQHGTW